MFTLWNKDGEILGLTQKDCFSSSLIIDAAVDFSKQLQS